MTCYQVPLEINIQEDGLYRVESPHLQGCWVDAPTIKQAMEGIQEVIAMTIDIYEEDAWPLPEQVIATDALPLKATVPVVINEHKFRRISKGSKREPANDL